MPDAVICVISLNTYNGYMTEMILFPLLQMGKLRLILEISYPGFISIHFQNLLSSYFCGLEASPWYPKT